MHVVERIVSAQVTMAALCEEIRERDTPEFVGPLVELEAVVEDFSEVVRDALASDLRTLRERTLRLYHLACEAARSVDDVRFAEAVGGAVLALDRAVDPGRRTTWGGDEEGPGSRTSR